MHACGVFRQASQTFLILLYIITIGDRAPHPDYYLLRLGHEAQGVRKGQEAHEGGYISLKYIYIYIYILIRGSLTMFTNSRQAGSLTQAGR